MTHHPKLYAGGAVVALAVAAAAFVVVARGDAPVRAGSLLVEPASISFASEQREATLTLTNDGASSVGFDVSADQGWLGAQPAVGVVARGAISTVALVADRAGLEAGAQTATVLVSTVDGSANIPVVLTVDEAVPLSGPARLQATSSLRFDAAATAVDLRIGNGGSEVLRWDAEPADASLVLERMQGDLSGGATTLIRVSVDRSGLSPGVTTSSITVRSNGGDATVEVEIETGAIPLLVVPQTRLDFGSAREGTGTRDLEVLNGGLAPLRYQVSTGEPWVRVGEGASATIRAGARATVAVSYVFDEAPEGVQELTLKITSDGGDALVAIRGVHDTFAPEAKDRKMGEAHERCPDGSCAIYRLATAAVTDATDITDVQVRFRLCSQAPQSDVTCEDHRFVPMTHRSGDTYAAEAGPFPACATGTGSYILWQIYTEDSLGNKRLLPGTKTPEVRQHCSADGTMR